MQFNTEKCKVMHIGRHNPMFTYTIANKQLEAVKQERDLGVIIAENLTQSLRGPTSRGGKGMGAEGKVGEGTGWEGGNS